MCARCGHMIIPRHVPLELSGISANSAAQYTSGHGQGLTSLTNVAKILLFLFATGHQDYTEAKLCIFTALHGMHTRYSDEHSVCPSVYLSVCLSVRPSQA